METSYEINNFSSTSNNNFNEEEVSPSYFRIIDSNVWEDETLSPFAVLLYGLLNSLTTQKGYAFASNKKLVELMPKCAFKNCTQEKAKVDLVKKWLLNLEERGHIFIESKKVEFKWDRKIYTAQTRGFKKSLPSYSTVASEATPKKPLEDKSIKNKKEKRDKKERKGGNPPPPLSESDPPLSHFFEKEFSSEAKVSLSEPEHKDLLEKFGKEKFDQLVEDLGFYKKMGKKPSSEKDYYNLLNFNRRQLADRKIFRAFTKTNHRELALKIREKANKSHADILFHFASEYCEIRRGSEEPTIVSWEDKNFEEKVRDALAKRGITL